MNIGHVNSYQAQQSKWIDLCIFWEINETYKQATIACYNDDYVDKDWDLV